MLRSAGRGDAYRVCQRCRRHAEFGRLVGFSGLDMRDEFAVLLYDRGTAGEGEIEAPGHGSQHFAMLPPELGGMAVIVPLVHDGMEGSVELAVLENVGEIVLFDQPLDALAAPDVAWQEHEAGAILARRRQREPDDLAEEPVGHLDQDEESAGIFHQALVELTRLGLESNALTSLKLDFTWEMKENSDHYPFFAQRIPTMMVHTGLHADYHTPRDDANRVNPKGMKLASQLLFSLVYELSSRPTVSTFRSESFNEYPQLKHQLEQPIRPATPRLGIVWRDVKSNRDGLVVDELTAGGPAFDLIGAAFFGIVLMKPGIGKVAVGIKGANPGVAAELGPVGADRWIEVLKCIGGEPAAPIAQRARDHPVARAVDFAGTAVSPDASAAGSGPFLQEPAKAAVVVVVFVPDVP